MENLKQSLLYKEAKNWWVFLLMGIVGIALGVIALLTPTETFLTLTLLFVVSFLILGFMEILFALSNRATIRNWGWRLAMGIIDLLFGIFLFFNMKEDPAILSFFIGFWLMFQAIWGIASSIEMQNVAHSDWGWMLALSILLLLASFILIFNPLDAALFAVYLVSFALIIYGVFSIYFSFKLKSVKNDYIHLKNHLHSDN